MVISNILEANGLKMLFLLNNILLKKRIFFFSSVFLWGVSFSFALFIEVNFDFERFVSLWSVYCLLHNVRLSQSHHHMVTHLAIAKKQKSAVNVLLLDPTLVRKFDPELANKPEIIKVFFYI